MFKRSREDDGQISREDYSRNESIAQLSSTNASFQRANADAMASRRIVSAKRSRKDEFLRHMKALNGMFVDWTKSIDDKSVSIVDGCQDYIDYCQELQQRYLRSHGEVLTFGSGDCGQLAHGLEDDNDLTVRYPRIVYSLRDKKVCGIACGGLHNAVFTETGQVYTWGCSDDGSLGRIGEEGMPALVDALANEIIIGVACGDGQTLALTSTGEVYGWGCYKDKEGNKWFNPGDNKLAWQDIKKQQNQPQLILGLANIVELACGSSFNLARSDDGKVYSWGIGECGELGREVAEVKAGRGSGDEKVLKAILETHITPGPMFLDSSPTTSIANVKAIGCGSYHAMVVTAGGKLFSSGLNNYAQLGLGNTDNKKLLCEVTSIHQLTTSPIKSVKGGMHHTLALTSDGTMLAWGRSDYGQLGVKASESSSAGSYSATPVLPIMPADVKVQEISCGGNHNLALASMKSEPRPMVYTWGYGDMSALGHGKDQDEPIPRRIDFAKGAKITNITVTQVAGGGQHSAIIGQVLSA